MGNMMQRGKGAIKVLNDWGVTHILHNESKFVGYVGYITWAIIWATYI